MVYGFFSLVKFLAWMFNHDCFCWAGNVFYHPIALPTNRKKTHKANREWIHPTHCVLCISSCVMTLCNAIWKMVDVRRWSTRDFVTVTHAQVIHKCIAVIFKRKKNNRNSTTINNNNTQIDTKNSRPKTYRAWKTKISKQTNQNEIDDHRKTLPETNQLFSRNAIRQTLSILKYIHIHIHMTVANIQIQISTRPKKPHSWNNTINHRTRKYVPQQQKSFANLSVKATKQKKKEKKVRRSRIQQHKPTNIF